MTAARHLPVSTARPRRAVSRRSALTATAALLLAACSKKDDAAPAAAAPAADPSDAKAAYEKASKGTGFAVGQAMAARSLLVFFDPQCPHCAALWQAAKPLHDKLRMVWMPVAFMGPASAPQGALILSAADPVATMDRHETLLAERQGGLPHPDPIAPDLLAKIEANTELWKAIGAGSVPHILWRLGADGPWGAHAGGMDTATLRKTLGL